MITPNGLRAVGLVSFAQLAVLVLSVQSADFWQQRADYTIHVDHTTVFTGTEIIVWGGPVWLGEEIDWSHGRGSVYDLAQNVWSPTSLVDAPEDRYNHTAVWTGKEMVIWGGIPRDDNGRYDPKTDSWRTVTLIDAPSPRSRHTAVWTGKEMIIWGGQPFDPERGLTSEGLANGRRYDPETDTWTSIAAAPLRGRFDHTAVWTGSEMLIYGGHRIDQVGSNEWLFTTFEDGARYNPTTDTWTMMNVSDGPGARTQHGATWTGSEMIVWGGAIRNGLNLGYSGTVLNSGAIYDPATDSWEPISLSGAPERRVFPIVVWSGEELIVWGGQMQFYIGRALNTGGRYDLRHRRWEAITQEGGPGTLEVQRPETGLWTGEALFVHAPIFDYDANSFSTNNYTWLYYPEKPHKHPREQSR